MATDFSFLDKLGKAKDSLEVKEGSPLYTSIKIWVDKRIEEAKENLIDSGNNTTGTLGASIVPDIIEEDRKVLVKVYAESYYDFINSGVNGLNRSFGAPYSFKSLGVGTAMHDAFKTFVRNKGIRATIKSSSKVSLAQEYDRIAYAMAKSVKKKGIEPNHFLDNAFSEEKLRELSEILGKEVVRLFE